jgi:methyl-accepting chemotaxis protein
MICNHWDSTIWLKYKKPDMEKYPLVAIYHYEDYSKLSDTDRVQVEIIDFIQTWSVFFYSIAGILGASYLFYKNKLKKPLQILNEAAEKIGRNDLDIEIQYEIKDEMGKLIDGTVSDAMQLGIDVYPTSKINEIKEKWRPEKA